MMGLEYIYGGLGAIIAFIVLAFFRGKKAGRAAADGDRRKASDALRRKYDEIDRDGSTAADAYGRLRKRGGK